MPGPDAASLAVHPPLSYTRKQVSLWGSGVIDVRDDLVTALAGRYDIERELGHGGMAIVYLARDARHDRHVAIKVLRPELATSLGAERFLREINIAARLTHPNILALHDSGNAAGMLYFVMPHVEGETLRDRLEREHQLPLDDALSITRQVGLALDYAHEHGVVHRDIKPENILLLGDHVLVADFGLARALYTAGTIRLTESAVAVGTPAYMSPEQAAADPEVDGRTDLYSLACVLFEMVAGTPPFKGATGAALLAQHLTATPPSICAQRPHCPPSVDSAVARALEKTPADRFRTAREFYAALTAQQPSPAPAQYSPAGAAISRPPRFAVAGSALVVVVALGAAFAVMKGRRSEAEAPGSAGRAAYVVLPLTASDPASRADTGAISQALADALGEWDGVRVVGAREVGDELSRLRGTARLTLDDALAMAGRLGGTRLVWGQIDAQSGRRMARVSVYDVATRQELRPVELAYGPGEPTRADVRLTVNTLLRSRAESPWTGNGPTTHPSLDAWLAYDSGRTALDRWDIDEAARHFRNAVAIDAAHPQGNLWLSLVQMWAGAPAESWRGAARRASQLRDRLDPRDTALASAQLALAEARFPEACAAYTRVAAHDTTGVIGLYGLGECRSRDSLVIRNPASPSQWSFRGSTSQAIGVYLKIIEDRPAAQPTFVYSRLSQLVYTSGIQLRPGHSENPGRIEFGGYTGLSGDTLVVIPYPLNDPRAAAGPPSAESRLLALEHNRELLRRLYREWAANAPATVDAHATLAKLLESMEEIGSDKPNPLSALWQLRRARALATDSSQQLLLVRSELRLLVKRADWAGAAHLADSVFAANPNPADDTTGALAGAAALTGRVRTLAAILRARGGAGSYTVTLPDGIPPEVGPALEQDAAGSFAWAVSGACVDSLRGYRARVDRQLASYIPDPKRRAVARGVLLRGPLSIGMPCVGADALLGVDSATDKMVMLEQALGARDTTAFRAVYNSLLAFRALHRPGDTAMDYTYIESWILRALGDTAEATAHLDQSLDALPTLGPYVLDFPSHSAGLVRSMALRAELAAAAGDRATAARWGAAVATLWAHADPELGRDVQAMCRLAASCTPARTAASRR